MRRRKTLGLTNDIHVRRRDEARSGVNQAATRVINAARMGNCQEAYRSLRLLDSHTAAYLAHAQSLPAPYDPEPVTIRYNAEKAFDRSCTLVIKRRV